MGLHVKLRIQQEFVERIRQRLRMIYDNLERQIVVIMHTVRKRVTREYLVALLVCEGILVNI